MPPEGSTSPPFPPLGLHIGGIFDPGSSQGRRKGLQRADNIYIRGCLEKADSIYIRGCFALGRPRGLSGRVFRRFARPSEKASRRPILSIFGLVWGSGGLGILPGVFFRRFARPPEKASRRPSLSIFGPVLSSGGLRVLPGVFFDVSQGLQKRPPQGLLYLYSGLFGAREASGPFWACFATYRKSTRKSL